MWFSLENKRKSTGQKYVVRCSVDAGGQTVAEERVVQGAKVARELAGSLSSTLSANATVYGQDAEGEFVFGVEEIAEGAGNATDPLVRKLFAEATSATLHFRDQLMADIPADTIKGFAALATALGYVVAEHKKTKRNSASTISYAALFRVLCGPEPATTVSLKADRVSVGLLSGLLRNEPGWMCLSELTGAGDPDSRTFMRVLHCSPVTLKVDDKTEVIRTKAAFRGTIPKTDRHFVLVVEWDKQSRGPGGVGLIYREQDEAATIDYVRKLLERANPFRNRVVLLNRDLYTVRSRMSDRSWADIIPHTRAREELDFIAAAIRERDMLRQEGLPLRRGLLLSGPPGDGKSTAIECFVNEIAGQATVVIVEAVDHIRSVYELAQRLAPAVVILEDLDLMTKQRQTPYPIHGREDVTGELLQVLSGGSAYNDIVTIATTNHPEAIDDALAKRAGRFDAHVRMGYPSEEDKLRILELYLDRFGIRDEFTSARLRLVFAQEFAKLLIVPAHIEEFVKAGVKRARLARRDPQFQDFEPGIAATKSIAVTKPAA